MPLWEGTSLRVSLGVSLRVREALTCRHFSTYWIHQHCQQYHIEVIKLSDTVNTMEWVMGLRTEATAVDQKENAMWSKKKKRKPYLRNFFSSLSPLRNVEKRMDIHGKNQSSWILNIEADGPHFFPFPSPWNEVMVSEDATETARDRGGKDEGREHTCALSTRSPLWLEKTFSYPFLLE